MFRWNGITFIRKSAQQHWKSKQVYSFPLEYHYASTIMALLSLDNIFTGQHFSIESLCYFNFEICRSNGSIKHLPQTLTILLKARDLKKKKKKKKKKKHCLIKQIRDRHFVFLASWYSVFCKIIESHDFLIYSSATNN